MMQTNLVKIIEIAFPLKYLSNFWKSLNMPLINSDVSLILTWFRECVLLAWKEE